MADNQYPLNLAEFNLVDNQYLLNLAEFSLAHFYRNRQIRQIFFPPKFLPLTLFRMGREREGGKKGPPTSFSPVTSTNVRFGLKNFLTFSFNPFSTLVQNFKFVPSASLKLLNLNQNHSSKKVTFPGQILIKLRL